MRYLSSLIIFFVLSFCSGALLSHADEEMWQIKALTQEGSTLDIKAFDKKGNAFEIKAIEEDGNTWLMDIKAFVDGKRVPVKILVSDEKNMPVKAIGEGGEIMDVKAIAPNGDKLDVKGVGSMGSIIHIKVLVPGGEQYSVKSISKQGDVDDGKGVRILAPGEKAEMEIDGVAVYAHIKSLPPEDID
jgi:hypothetical protein